MLLDHFGIATKDIEKSYHEYSFLGFKKVSEIIQDLKRNLVIQFIANNNFKIELISVLDSDKSSPIDNILKNSKTELNIPYHTCYEVEDIQKSVQDMINNKYILINQSESATAFNERKVAFLYRINFGIIELLEK